MRTRTLWALTLLLLAAVPPLLAQGEITEAQEPARFLIETITVVGPTEAAANIVLAETLLEKGKTYTEDQLRQAIYRLHRLPFVLDASFALRKGSERGAYELVIEVQPTRWFFFDHWIRAFRFAEPLDIEESFRTDPTMRSTFDLGGLAGARLFVGRSGVLFGALDSEEGIQVGFTKYDLFHRGALVSAGYSRTECCVREVLPLALDPTFTSWSFDSSRKISLGLAIPLGGPQSIQLSLSERRGDVSSRRNVIVDPQAQIAIIPIAEGELAYGRAEAKWVYDTSDDPLLPTRGMSLSAGLEAARFDGQDLVEIFPSVEGDLFPIPVPDFHSEQVVAAASAIRHWPITPRQTVSVTGRAFGGTSRLKNLTVRFEEPRDVDLDTFGGSLGVQHAMKLRQSRRAGNFADMRLESGVEVGIERTSPDLGPSPLERFSAWVGLVFRNQWGRVRVLLSYLDLGKILQ
ncbi:MAG TPA: hypothetical protein VIC28_07655 [Thermoanaerobaculia bacterium]